MNPKIVTIWIFHSILVLVWNYGFETREMYVTMAWRRAADVVFSKKADVAENYNSLNEFAFERVFLIVYMFMWNLKSSNDNICPFVSFLWL